MHVIPKAHIAQMAEGAGRDANLSKSHDFCGFSILAVRLSVSRSVYPKQPLFGG
jgi:hypothetical protein